MTVETNLVVLQARTGSSRLPGKALLPLGGMPLSILAAKRAANTGKRVILATSVEQSDDVLAQEAAAWGVEVVRGPLKDVLARFLKAIEGLPDNALITRLTGDNPVPDGALIDEVEAEFLDRDLDYITTTHPVSGLPYGVSVEVTRAGHLRESARNVISANAREHVTSDVIARYGATPFLGRASVGKSSFRMTVDCFDDYQTQRRVFATTTTPLTVHWSDLVAQAACGLYQPSGLGSLSKIVMGTVQLGLDYGVTLGRAVTRSEREVMIKTAIGEGVESLDTARAYGQSEDVIGSVLATGWSGRCQVVTKLDPLLELTNAHSAKEWQLAAEASVMRSCVALGAKCLDTLLVHRAAHLTVADGAVWALLLRLQEQGVIGRLGASVQTTHELELALNTPGVEHVQLPCNLLDSRWQPYYDRLEKLKDSGKLQVHVRSVFLQGLLLSDKIEDWRNANVHAPEQIIDWLTEATKVNGRINKADLCLGWALAQNWVDGVVVGADNLAQLTENLKLGRRMPLTAEAIEHLVATRPSVSSSTLDPAQWRKAN
ncbi:aldo/keto reductase [Qipengyuania huizhouensis]|uniref:aldo/keto reductase n=1 Tax=Qipengyuania huizhouensis TaxID=2867245 RepID=UPI001C87DF0F|nr:aldo/keto reductase [Qipengyuania huizhouensis]MBX7460378.1 aldo/keto reductase [Qipengyuania huizhouensis]